MIPKVIFLFGNLTLQNYYTLWFFPLIITGQQISKKIFVSEMNMLLMYLLAPMKVENGH
jgi:hypothetical protein